MKKVLFVCTGNTCRSPMAEALFNHFAKDDLELYAFSCGIYGDGISPISDNAKTALLEAGIEFSHTSTPIDESLLKEADFIVGMTESHARRIITMYPCYEDKIFTMPKDISDPFGGDLEDYRKCRDEIKACIMMLIKALSGENNG